MKKTPNKKITLGREIIRCLTFTELDVVVAGNDFAVTISACGTNLCNPTLTGPTMLCRNGG